MAAYRIEGITSAISSSSPRTKLLAQGCRELARLESRAEEHVGLFLHESTVAEIPVTVRPLGGAPARLARGGQTFVSASVPYLVSSVRAPEERLEESFLFHEELLRVAVDSLDGTEQLERRTSRSSGSAPGR